MDASTDPSTHGAHLLVGMAITIILVSMASGWLLRTLLLRTLRDRHPEEFAKLGQPSNRQLASLLPRNREVQLQFWRFLWGRNFLLMKDRFVSGLALGAMISDVVLGAGVVLLFWGASR